MRRTAAVLVLLGLVGTACTDDRVPLSYRLEPGARREYRLHLDAEITRTLAGDTRDQHVDASFHTSQEILGPLPEGGVQASMSLVPEELVVDGRPVDVGPEQQFTVHLGSDGRVVEIEEAAGAGAEALQPVGFERLLPRLRPVLPGVPVATGDTWESDTSFDDESGHFSLTSSSRLAQLGIADGYRAALVRTTYVSPVDRREAFANAVAEMEGSDVGAQEAWFALDGFLVRSSGDSVGNYRLTFSPPGGEVGIAPVEGALLVRLHTELRLIG